jgi:GNAT superfamily N-acetyltransferase
MTQIEIREARREDAGTIVALIEELAAFEKLSHEAKASHEDILRDGFGERPYFECLLAERAGEAIGFALYFSNYSTFEGRPGLFLEDLFVSERARGLGIGRMLLTRLAAITVERGWRRLDLQVLHWNPARDFYHRLGIQHNEQWLPYRLTGQALLDLAAEA